MCINVLYCALTIYFTIVFSDSDMLSNVKIGDGVDLVGSFTLYCSPVTTE